MFARPAPQQGSGEEERSLSCFWSKCLLTAAKYPGQSCSPGVTHLPVLR